MNDLIKLRKKLVTSIDEYAHECMRSPASDQFQHGIQIGYYRALESIIAAINESLREEDSD